MGTRNREKKKDEMINFFEVLEDRYAYEGFNKFIFYCFVFFTLYQWAFSVFRNVDNMPGHVNVIRNKLLPQTTDTFEREDMLHAWYLKIVKDMTHNPKYFGEKYN